MSRVKGGPHGHLRHKKLLKKTEGYSMSRHLLIRRANEGLLKAMWYATRDRKIRKRDLRKLWITRINAASRLNGLTYSQLIHGMKAANIELNRKMLADIAVKDPNTFTSIAQKAKS
jgi:large subunit ribosomal protein L20